MTPDFGLYVHIPFCLKRCGYCSFTSIPYDTEVVGSYLNALAQELLQQDRLLDPHTIYIGGGTPTSLSIRQLEDLLSLLHDIGSRQAREFTIEANPGTLSIDKLRILREAGVNRISIGVQSFQESALSALGRIHSAKEAQGAIAMARETGFDNVSIDLIYGWPGQTPALWTADLERAVHMDIPHLSCYCLSYEEGTPLTEKRRTGSLAPLSEDAERELFDLTESVLAGCGRPRYEISNFAVVTRECLHNLNYWCGGEYLGVGAGAHSHIDGTRFANTDNIHRYCKALLAGESARDFEETLSPEHHARECAVIWLRLMAGIDPERFEAQTGFALEPLLGEPLSALLDQGLLEWSGNRLRLTKDAVPVADSILSELIVE